MAVFGQELLYSGNIVVFGQGVVFGKSGCIRIKLAKCLYSGKRCCIQAIVVVLGQNLFYSGKVVIFGKLVVFGQKWLYSNKVVVFRQKWLYSGSVVVLGKSGCTRLKVVVF